MQQLGQKILRQAAHLLAALHELRGKQPQRAADDGNMQRLQKALAAPHNDLGRLVEEWMPQLQGALEAVWAEQSSRRLHLILRSHNELAAALKSTPLLV